MAALIKFDLSVLESLTKVLGNTNEGFTGTEIGKLLFECDIPDPCPNMTKWKRLYEAFSQKTTI